MTDKQLEQNLKQAVEHAAPDDLEGVLSRCRPREETIIEMDEHKKITNKRQWLRGLAAACLALVLAGGGGLYYQQAYAVASVVSLDVNPSIELRVNRNERVLTCAALNEDAAAVLADMDGGADLEGAKLEVAVNAVVGALLRAGYLDRISSAILISVEDNDQGRAERIQQELETAVNNILRGFNNSSAVYSMNMTMDAGDLPTLDDTPYSINISRGKAALVQQVMLMNGTIYLNNDVAFKQLSALSVEELMDLLETGEKRIPIGMAAAAMAAEEYCGALYLSRDTVRSIDPKLDDPVPHYEVLLDFPNIATGELSKYIVDAFTGEVLDCTHQYDD